MAIHLVIRKNGITREDIKYLLNHASCNDIGCYIKETYWTEFCDKFSLQGVATALGPPKYNFDEIPETWLDLKGEIVFNSMNRKNKEIIEALLGVEFPTTSSNKYDWKRGKGGTIRVVSPSNLKYLESKDIDKWLCSKDILAKLNNKNLSFEDQDIQATQMVKTLRAIAERGFECRLLL